MRYILLFVFISTILFANLSLAQCTIHNQTDQFTNVTTYFTDKIKVSHGGIGTLLKSGNDYSCTYNDYVRFVAGNGEIYLSIIEDADKCMCKVTSIGLKFENGTVLTRRMTKEGNEVNTLLGLETYTFYKLTKEDLKQFADNAIVNFRLQEEYCPDHLRIEKEMRDKAAKEIMDGARCILQKVSQ